MCVCVYIYIRIYASIYTYMYVCIYLCIDMAAFICICRPSFLISEEGQQQSYICII